MPLGIGRGSGVAVVEMHGVIGSQIRASAYSRIFEAVARNKSHRALLLDIDSPGGSAAASESLHRSIERVAETKPVYAYVRGMGASGGYYLCCAASQVYAMPTSLLGSIGVIYLRPVLEQLLGRAGIEFTIFKGGKYKDMTGFWRSPTSEEAERLQGLINEIYDNFVGVVIKGRSPSRRKGEGTGDRRGDYRTEGTGRRTYRPPRGLYRRPERRCRGRQDPPAAQVPATAPQPVAAAYGPGVRRGHRLMAGLAGGLQRMLSGGIYYLDPAYVAGWPGES